MAVNLSERNSSSMRGVVYHMQPLKRSRSAPTLPSCPGKNDLHSIPVRPPKSLKGRIKIKTDLQELKQSPMIHPFQGPSSENLPPAIMRQQSHELNPTPTEPLPPMFPLPTLQLRELLAPPSCLSLSKDGSRFSSNYSIDSQGGIKSPHKFEFPVHNPSDNQGNSDFLHLIISQGHYRMLPGGRLVPEESSYPESDTPRPTPVSPNSGSPHASEEIPEVSLSDEPLNSLIPLDQDSFELPHQPDNPVIPEAQRQLTPYPKENLRSVFFPQELDPSPP